MYVQVSSRYICAVPTYSKGQNKQENQKMEKQVQGGPIIYRGRGRGRFGVAILIVVQKVLLFKNETKKSRVQKDHTG